MVKSIIKEIIIMLLLLVAIVLILGVIFYDSIPSNKVVPNKLSAYTTPENIQAEIDEQVTQMNKVEVSYEITSSDINLFRQTKSYVPSKPDPFGPATTTNTANPNGGTANTTGNEEENGNSTSTITDPKSTGTFFNNDGRK